MSYGSALASLTLIVAAALGAVGCGESSHPTTTAAAASSTTPADTTPADSNSAGSSQGSEGKQVARGKSGHTAASNPASASSGSAATGTGTRRSKAHLVLPGPNSRPAPRLAAGEQTGHPIADIDLASPAITVGGGGAPYSLPVQYTCHGQNRSPPLQWKNIPAGTSELVLFALNTQPVDGKLFFDWALAGIKPSLTGLPAGVTPAGAVQGRNSSGRQGYSICPVAGKHESYIFMLYALPQSLSPTPGFDPATFRQEAKRFAHHIGLLVGNYG